MFIAAEFHRNSANMFSRPVSRVVLNIFFDNIFFADLFSIPQLNRGF
jgi:hypothetical protein